MTPAAERHVELTLPMLPDVEISAVHAAGELARELGMSEHQIDELSHALVEACINAREHSCCADERIYLRFVGSTQGASPKMEIWVTDHGRGFDPGEARSRRHNAPAGPKKRGWGLQIIEAHMDEVEIITGADGTTIHMVKYGEMKQA